LVVVILCIQSCRWIYLSIWVEIQLLLSILYHTSERDVKRAFIPRIGTDRKRRKAGRKAFTIHLPALITKGVGIDTDLFC